MVEVALLDAPNWCCENRRLGNGLFISSCLSIYCEAVRSTDIMYSLKLRHDEGTESRWESLRRHAVLFISNVISFIVSDFLSIAHTPTFLLSTIE